MRHMLVVATALAAATGSAGAQEPPIDLALPPGRTLQLALDRKVRIGRVGQPVSATVIEPVYSYDRIVVPAGTRARGHIERLEKLPRPLRVRAVVGGDFTPLRHAVLSFDTLTFADGREVAIRTHLEGGFDNVALAVARPSGNKGRVARVAAEAVRQAGLDLEALRGPGKLGRLKDAFVRRLPYHPQYLARGTVYSAELLAPIEFGTVAPVERAAAGELAAPDSVLHARLLTALSSATSTRGAPVRAVLTRPLLSADGRLILPEGSELDGEVTFSKAARHLHRNGQLRFLFETVNAPGAERETLKASLHAAELGRGQGVVIDEEGGTRVANSNRRFILPAIALLTLHSSLESEGADPGEAAAAGGGGSDILAQGPGGFVGWSLLGVALSQTSRPVAAVLGVVGLARSTYGAVFGKGRDVVIPAHTPLELQLAPEAAAP